MKSKIFDPIRVEREMVEAGMMRPRADTPNPRYATLEHYFTEADPRKYALWRISMVRQFQPEILRHLPDDDLLYIAGQSPEGYVGEEVYGVQLDRNKVTQNAARARVELDRRATRGAWLRGVALAAVSLVLGALLTALGGLWAGG